MLKFNMYNITDTETGLKVSVWYSQGIDIHGKTRVWIYEKGYTRNLFKMFNNAVNESEIQTDYIEETRVSFYEGHPHYETIVKICERLEAARFARRQKKAA